MSTTNLQEALVAIQSGMKAPKGQFNEFGGYAFRSAEDILAASKPFIAEHKCILLLSDEVVCIEGRHYVKVSASLTRGAESITVNAYAREPEHKKGMDEAQITGATSSYARKYALNGLFCLDDIKDADHQDNRGADKQQPRGGSNGAGSGTKPTTIRRTDLVGFGKHKDSSWSDVPDEYLEWVQKNTKDDHVRVFVTQELNFRKVGREEQQQRGVPAGPTVDDFHRELIGIEKFWKEQKALSTLAGYLQATFSTTDLQAIAMKHLRERVGIIDDLRGLFKQEFPDWTPND